VYWDPDGRMPAKGRSQETEKIIATAEAIQLWERIEKGGESVILIDATPPSSTNPWGFAAVSDDNRRALKRILMPYLVGSAKARAMMSELLDSSTNSRTGSKNVISIALAPVANQLMPFSDANNNNFVAGVGSGGVVILNPDQTHEDFDAEMRVHFDTIVHGELFHAYQAQRGITPVDTDLTDGDNMDAENFTHGTPSTSNYHDWSENGYREEQGYGLRGHYVKEKAKTY
jgi:hypothetical protein